MNTTIMTTKGQIVIPAKIRKRLKILTGTKFSVEEKKGELLLKPIGKEYLEKFCGILDTKGKLCKNLLKEREISKRLEDKK